MLSSPLLRRRLLFPGLSGLLALALVLPASAQTTSTRKKLHPSGTSSVPKKKVREEAPEEDPPAPVAKPKKAAPEAEIAVPEKADTGGGAQNATIAPQAILEYKDQPAGVRKLIEAGLELAGQNLTYTFGSADPANGGMDCSGFIYYVLRQQGLSQVPRDSSGLYSWVRKARGFRAVMSRKADSSEMDEMLPGDLLFWTGTYATQNDPPISHTMLYLGTEKSTGAKIMVGSSDGRTYHGQKRNGVSVFDFVLPRQGPSGETKASFIGYARIPGMRD